MQWSRGTEKACTPIPFGGNDLTLGQLTRHFFSLPGHQYKKQDMNISDQSTVGYDQ
jgi:hypothetical protein